MGERHLRAWSTLLGASQVGAWVRPGRDAQRLAEMELANVIAVSAEQPWPESARWASVCTPTTSHHETALPLLSDGVHVVVEKPVAAALDDAQRLADAGPGRCFVAHTCRAEATTIAALAAASDALARAEIHAVHVERFERHRPLPAETPSVAEHGRLLDVLVHDISAVLDALPSATPSEVTARWDDENKRFSATWRWPSVTLVSVQHRRADYSARSVELAGAGAKWGWYLAPGTRGVWRSADDTPVELEVSWQDPTTTLLAEAHAAVAQQRTSYIDAHHGVRAMQLAAEALSALPAATFSGPFRWDYVR